MDKVLILHSLQSSSFMKCMKELNERFTSIQADITEIKETQSTNYKELNNRLAESQNENRELKTQLNKAIDRIDTLERCNGHTINNMERAKKDGKAKNIIIRGAPEVENEKMQETMNELVAPAKGQLTYIQTDGAIRLGQRNKGQQGGQQGQG